MVGAPGVPAGTARTAAMDHRMLTQRVVQPIYVGQLDSHPRLALVAWDGAIRGQEDQEGGGHHRSLKAHLSRRARDTLRACIPNTAFLIPLCRRERKRGHREGEGTELGGQRLQVCRAANGWEERVQEHSPFPPNSHSPLHSLPHMYQSRLAIDLWHLPSFYICCS